MADTVRIDEMRELQVWQCPNWCVAPDDEGDQQSHVGEWQDVLVGSLLTIRARPVLDWMDTNDDRPGTAYVDISIGGRDADPIDQGDTANLCLETEDYDTMAGGCDEVLELAKMTAPGCKWVWAWDTAEEEYNAAPEDEDTAEEEYANAS